METYCWVLTSKICLAKNGKGQTIQVHFVSLVIQVGCIYFPLSYKDGWGKILGRILGPIINKSWQRFCLVSNYTLPRHNHFSFCFLPGFGCMCIRWKNHLMQSMKEISRRTRLGFWESYVWVVYRLLFLILICLTILWNGGNPTVEHNIFFFLREINRTSPLFLLYDKQ